MAPGGGPSGAGGARARSQSDLRLDVITEFLEAATHHTLHARGVYPKELFEARAFYGARVQKSRHPDLDAYVADAVHALRGPHYRGIQFHAESILTQNGFDLLHTLVRDLLVGEE